MKRILDSDGENLPVRWFLAAYGAQSGMTIRTMKAHLSSCGYALWPEWCEKVEAADEHLNKAAAQEWLRYLFDLERTTPPTKEPTP